MTEMCVTVWDPFLIRLKLLKRVLALMSFRRELDSSPRVIELFSYMSCLTKVPYQSFLEVTEDAARYASASRMAFISPSDL